MHYSKKIQFLFISYFLFLLSTSYYVFQLVAPTYYASVAITTSAIIALSAAFMGIFFQRKTARENNSLSFQTSLADNEKYEKSIHVVIKAIRNNTEFPVENFSLKEHHTSDQAVAFRYVLNTWERAANAMLHGLYDEKYLYHAHKSMVLLVGIHLRLYISKLQQDNASYFCNLNWLVLKWTIRRDSFEEKETKKRLKKIFRLLNSVRHGRIPNKLK
jgi:hypothetical protein